MSASPNAPRPQDPLVRAVADALAAIERNYAQEGSGPGSRFEGRLLEDVQAERVTRMVWHAAGQEPLPSRALSLSPPDPADWDYPPYDGPRWCARCGALLADRDELGWYRQVSLAVRWRPGATFLGRVHECDGRPHAVVDRSPW